MQRRGARPFGGCACACAVVLAVLPVIAPAAAPNYRIVDLGTLGGDQSWGVAINDAGQVTGGSLTAVGNRHAFLYADGTMIDLGTLGGNESWGNDVNESGEVTGWAERGDTRNAFLYAGGAMLDIGNLGGFSEGIALNNAGQVTGLSGTLDSYGSYEAFLYSLAERKMRNLGTLGDSYSEGDSINDAGEVVGTYAQRYSSRMFLDVNGSMRDVVSSDFSYVPPGAKAINARGDVVGSYGDLGRLHAFLYRGGAAIDLGTLGGTSSFGQAVNAGGDVTGYSTTSAGEAHAFLYSNGVLQDLGTGGGGFSEGVAINDSGEVAGTTDVTGAGPQAFVYANGRMILLDASELGAIESYGVAINTAGQVVGQYAVPNDPYEPTYRTFIATPISLLFARLEALAAEVEHGRDFEMQVDIAAKLYAAEAVAASCSMLGAVVREAQARAPRVPAAATFATDAAVVESALGCDEAGKAPHRDSRSGNHRARQAGPRGRAHERVADGPSARAALARSLRIGSHAMIGQNTRE